MSVNEGSEVYSENAAAGLGGQSEGRSDPGFQPCLLWSVSLRGEMRLADGSVWKVSSLSK